MKKIFILLFSFCLLNGLSGQSKPIFFPDQIDNSSDLHKPGITNQSRSKGIELSFQSNAEEIHPSFEVEPTNHPFIKLGLFLSPPNNLIK